MKHLLIFISIFLLICIKTHANQENSAIIFKAMNDEMQRSIARLEMEKLGKPYFIALTTRERTKLNISASFGSIKQSSISSSRGLKADLRLGSADFDNTHFLGGTFLPINGRLTLGDNYDALRNNMWLICDAAYKRALDTISKKKAYKERKLIKEEIPDLSPATVQTNISEINEIDINIIKWEKIVRDLSAVFRNFPAIQKSAVSLSGSHSYYYFVDSEGRKILKPVHNFSLVMSASSQAEDGIKLGDKRRIIRNSSTEFPSYAELEKQATAFAENMSDLVKAEAWEGIYLGPVLLEGQAAAEFFNQLLARNISSPRAFWSEYDSSKQAYQPGAITERLGLRVLSPIFNVIDDPSVKTFQNIPLIGQFDIDDEGISAEKVDLIDKGILKNLLMSRSPTKKRTKSNGHGRSDWRRNCDGRIGNLFINPTQTATPEQMQKEFLAKAKEYGQDYGIIIRRISRHAGSEKLGKPILAYKVDLKTGDEKLVRHVRFNDVTLRSLRDIIMAGDQQHVYNIFQSGPATWSYGKIPVSIIYPSVLVSEMELERSEKKPDSLPYIPHPSFEKRKLCKTGLMKN